MNDIHDAWGDLGNGLYKNPVLNADYSDPDVVRVNDDFYMVCSEFHFMGMPVLHSKDLVNWRIIGKVYDELKISEAYGEMKAYGKGSWAPAIKYHNGMFYVYFCTPDEGLYMSCATDPAGPWSPLYEVKRVRGWEDPCPFWDDDGNAYLGHSVLGAGPIVIHKMSADGKRLLDDGVIVYVGKIAEGTKIYKRNGYYYLVIPEGGVQTGWQAVLRSRSIYGPFEHKVTLQTGATIVNGPHQGSLIELENGEAWFMHFQSAGALGRVCHLQPVVWVDDWPVMGRLGEPVSIHKKPDVGMGTARCLPQASDDFSSEILGLQWQWNHNPVKSRWSLTERPGYLCMEALYAASIHEAKNTLTQKLMGTGGVVTVEMDISNMKDGQLAGLTFLAGTEENWIGIEDDGGKRRIEAVTGGVRAHGCEVDTGCVTLRTVIDLNGETYFGFMINGSRFIRIGGACKLRDGFWKGTRIGLFSYNKKETATRLGRADFNWFKYDLLFDPGQSKDR